mmetsp:Transcript_14242/g.30507  ORF Transcript_14242/g.30507 Transcript_14242/m.30507 type:complete len:272 (-) Transcript_14242:1353-2168(-)
MRRSFIFPEFPDRMFASSIQSPAHLGRASNNASTLASLPSAPTLELVQVGQPLLLRHTPPPPSNIEAHPLKETNSEFPPASDEAPTSVQDAAASPLPTTHQLFQLHSYTTLGLRVMPRPFSPIERAPSAHSSQGLFACILNGTGSCTAGGHMQHPLHTHHAMLPAMCPEGERYVYTSCYAVYICAIGPPTRGPPSSSWTRACRGWTAPPRSCCSWRTPRWPCALACARGGALWTPPRGGRPGCTTTSTRTGTPRGRRARRSPTCPRARRCR